MRVIKPLCYNIFNCCDEGSLEVVCCSGETHAKSLTSPTPARPSPNFARRGHLDSLPSRITHTLVWRSVHDDAWVHEPQERPGVRRSRSVRLSEQEDASLCRAPRIAHRGGRGPWIRRTAR